MTPESQEVALLHCTSLQPVNPERLYLKGIKDQAKNASLQQFFPTSIFIFLSSLYELIMLVTLGFALAALPVAFAATYDVSVGAGGKIAYDPEYVTAAVGDIVNFVL